MDRVEFKRQELKPLDSLQIILGMLRSRFPTTNLDLDNLAGDIWLELWEKDIHPSKKIIWFRAIDLIRAETARIKAHGRLNRFAKPLVDQDSLTRNLENKDLVDVLMECPMLNKVEKRIIFLRFYRELFLDEIGESMGIKKAYVSQILKKSMKKLRKWNKLASLDLES